MKILGWTKIILFFSLAAVYFSGLATFLLSHWFQVDSQWGSQASWLRLPAMQFHSIVSLWFLLVFGYIFHSHIEPSWRRGQKRKSGILLTASFAFLFATVPGLFYLSNEMLKNQVVWVHTYFGLALVVIFFIHYFTKKT